MDKSVLKQQQDLQNKKAEYLIELGKILSSQYRAGNVNDPDVAKLCEEVVKLDAQIGVIKNSVIDKDSGLCPECKQAVIPGATFCPNCGFAIQEFLSSGIKHCGICGGAITVDCQWCPICGVKQ